MPRPTTPARPRWPISKLIARGDLDLARAARDQARAQVNAAQAQITQQQASTRTTQLNLDRTVIRSPVDGVVLTRSIEPGQTVAASLQAPVLFQIAEDLAQMEIVLQIDEADIGQVKAGQDVRFTVDAFPERSFRGKVQQVRLSATNTNNVITYPVVVTVDNRDEVLLPGMTVNAEIEVSRRDDILKIPNAALRFKPADDAQAGAQAATPASRGGGMASELSRLAQSLALKPAQQAAFDDALAQMRQRMAARMAPSGAQQSGGGSVLFGRGPGGRCVRVWRQRGRRRERRDAPAHAGTFQPAVRRLPRHPGRRAEGQVGRRRHRAGERTPRAGLQTRRRHAASRWSCASVSPTAAAPKSPATSTRATRSSWAPTAPRRRRARNECRPASAPRARRGDRNPPARQGVSGGQRRGSRSRCGTWTCASRAGEFVAIMGPSGSGKSTLMNLLGCLDTPSAGTYHCDGVDVASLDAEDRARLRLDKIGFVFQGFNLLPRMSALENVAMPMGYANVHRGERLQRAHAALAAVGLGNRETHRPSEMSGGQQQRVAIARALINRPPILLADEPTGALDSRTGEEILALFKRLQQEDHTVVLITHDPDVAHHCDRIFAMRDGMLTEEAHP
jgi:ABC-type lipoprotein export system ATPase subunit